MIESRLLRYKFDGAAIDSLRIHIDYGWPSTAKDSHAIINIDILQHRYRISTRININLSINANTLAISSVLLVRVSVSQISVDL